MKNNRNRFWRFFRILFLVFCLVALPLGLSACGAAENPDSYKSQVSDDSRAVESSVDVPVQDGDWQEAESVQGSAGQGSESVQGVALQETDDESVRQQDEASESEAGQSKSTEITGSEAETTISASGQESGEEALSVEEDGTYSDRDHVALYIHTYGHLPDNYIRKDDARDLGWESSKGNLWDVAYGMSIGGDRFGNREGNLPEVKGRKYYECDINYEGGYRGGERIVYSSDGDVYYSEDHYANFELLYTKEGKAE